MIKTTILGFCGLLATGPALAQTAAPSDDVHGVEDDIVITAPFARQKSDLLSGVSVLTESQIAANLAPQIGEVIAHQPGVSATSFSPGASRPVLRGFSGERIRVLTDGIGSIDVSNTSADHAVTIDPITAQRVEIIRGPASLLYGSSAIGGVVNVLDKRIPRAVPDKAVHVDGIASYGSASDEVSLAAGADAAVTDTLVVHVDGSWRDTNDLRVGGYVLAPQLRREALDAAADGDDAAADFAAGRGRLPNSATRTYTFGGGVALIGDGGSLGASVGYFNTKYGVPERPVFGEDEGGADVSIDLEQWRFDLRAEVDLGDGFFETLRVRTGFADYTHVELEGAEIGTLFENQGVEGRVELAQAARGGWSGAIGGQFYIRDFSAEGEEAFLPPNETQQIGLFTVQSLDLGAFGVEGSARWEHSSVAAATFDHGRSFNAFSAALGAKYEIAEAVSVGVNVSRAVRTPSAEELFSNGPHVATQSFELGNPDLVKEKSWGLEGFVRGDAAGVTFAVGAFASWFSDYVYEADTGLREDGLPVFAYRQGDARYYGIEAEASAAVATLDDYTIVLDGVADAVRATIDNVGPAPRIPPLRLLGGVEAQSDTLSARIEAEWSDSQTRTAAFETATDSHTLVNASLSWKPLGERGPATLRLSANNIFDADARRHASFTKDFVPLAGRDVRVTLSLSL